MENSTAVLQASLEQLTRLAGDPLDGLTDEQLCTQTVEIEQLGRLLDTARVRVAAELADRSRFGLGNDSLAFRLGHGKAALLVEALTRVSPREASRRMRLGSSTRATRGFDGELLPSAHPRVAEALEVGSIGIDAAEVIVRCLDEAATRAGISLEAEENRAVAEEALVEMAATATADEVAVQARAWREALDPDGAEPRDEKIYRQRSLILGREIDGVRTIRGTLVGIDAALLQAAFDEAEKPGVVPRFLAENDEARGSHEVTTDDGETKIVIDDNRSRDQRRYDIFAGLLTAGVRASGGAPVEFRSTAQVTAVVTREDLEKGAGVGWLDGAEEPVSTLTIEQLVCANGKSLVVMGENGEPLYLYRGRRYFTEQQMQALAVRDGGCVWPGCHSPAAWADGHHVREYERDHGPTNIDNGVLLCPHHHRMLHHSDYAMKMIGGRPYLIPPTFIDPGCTPILLGRSRVGVNLALGKQLTYTRRTAHIQLPANPGLKSLSAPRRRAYRRELGHPYPGSGPNSNEGRVTVSAQTTPGQATPERATPEQATPERRISTSVLVIGTGGSGLRASIELAERGVDVLAVGKRPKNDAHTSLAAGGINAALGTMDAEDSWQQHAADTIKESYLLANPHTVEIVTKGARRGIEDLERYGMPFAREADGRISMRFFGAHKYRRTAFAGDYTGLEIQRTLVNRAAQLDIPILDSVYITRILVKDNVVFGAYGFDLNDGSRVLIHADAVILAAGGHNRIWRRTSSRRDENTGDSFRLAVLAGGRIRDPELVQFHPSGIIEPENAAGTLISEAARGEGGHLYNALGERFMEKYDPERMELSTRDRVALAAYTEIKEGRGTEKGAVLLDISHLPRETIMTKLPRVYQTMLELQMLDVTTTPMEIAPTAHYSMGGVWVRPEDHSTDVDGLYAIGEASSGLHGANRLGGNSLIELLVFGRIVGESAANYSAGLLSQQRSPEAIDEARTEIADLLAADGEENVRALQRAIRNTMTEHAGVVRDEAGLVAGLAELDGIEARFAGLGIHPDVAGFQDLAHAFDLKAAAIAARATLQAALERRETRGAHNRSDYPELDPSLQANLVWSRDNTTGESTVTRESIPPVPQEIADLMRDEVSVAGKLLE